jgi:pimeloyl-ACP methyl ester carboxylesterase
VSDAEFYRAYDALLARWPVPVEPVDVASVYGTTRVNVCGPADGEPLVLLHGGGATSTVWSGVVGELSLLAEQSRCHDVRRVDARARTLLRARTATLPGATHHSIPAAGADRIARELLAFG